MLGLHRDWGTRCQVKMHRDRLNIFILYFLLMLNFISVGFEWTSLPDDATVVDVGAGIGNISMKIAKANPKIKVVCQDLSKTVDAAKIVRICFNLV